MYAIFAIIVSPWIAEPWRSAAARRIYRVGPIAARPRLPYPIGRAFLLE
jgi:hypothetical protein